MKSFREVERQFVILNTPKYVVLTGILVLSVWSSVLQIKITGG